MPEHQAKINDKSRGNRFGNWAVNTKKLHHKLGTRFLIGIILISFMISALTVSAQLFVEYRSQLSNLSKVFTSIEKESLGAITQTTWHMNNKLLNIMVEGITHDSAIRYVRVVDTQGQILAVSGDREASDTAIEKIYPLVKLERLKGKQI